MDAAALVDRRAVGDTPRPGRRLLGAVRTGLYRQLADDGDRADYWARHARVGVLLSEIGAWAVVVYTLLTTTPARHSGLILALCALVIVGTPMVLLLPLGAMMRDPRGTLLFYAWSAAVTCLMVVASRIDGGGASPLITLLFLTLAFTAAAYPPAGVVLMGSFMTASYLLFVAWPRITLPVLFFAVVMGAFTMTCAMASANSWAAYDRQVLLIRTSEALAATDPLTGCPNRRAFLQRLAAAVTRAGRAAPTVVCLVDLDGFKGVNDRGGHAAGDAVLQSVAAALGGAVRETDTVARLGGDEFAVLAEVSPAVSAEQLAERLRDAVAAVGRASGVTASVGVAAVRTGDDLHDLLYRADSAMYRAKTAGGNRVAEMAL
jgi:diguanylate cyclase (GGDEF)-like protein